VTNCIASMKVSIFALIKSMDNDLINCVHKEDCHEGHRYNN
jgi:hypothetical protein